jgi:hypothetical protein
VAVKFSFVRLKVGNHEPKRVMIVRYECFHILIIHCLTLMRNGYKILVGKLEKKRPFWRSRLDGRTILR